MDGAAKQRRSRQGTATARVRARPAARPERGAELEGAPVPEALADLIENSVPDTSEEEPKGDSEAWDEWEYEGDLDDEPEPVPEAEMDAVQPGRPLMSGEPDLSLDIVAERLVASVTPGTHSLLRFTILRAIGDRLAERLEGSRTAEDMWQRLRTRPRWSQGEVQRLTGMSKDAVSRVVNSAVVRLPGIGCAPLSTLFTDARRRGPTPKGERR